MTTTCDCCGNPFTAKRKWQRFCADECRQRYHATGRDMPGWVDQIKQRADGDWSVTIKFRALPPLKRGDRCKVVMR